MEESPHAWGTSIFCDDIRFEMHGKISLIGIYQSDMIFSAAEFPIALPKFAILVRYLEAKGKFTDEPVLKVYFPGDEADHPQASTILKRTEKPRPSSLAEKYPLPDDSDPITGYMIPLIFAPVHIAQEGYIKVRVECGNTVTKLGTLLLRTAGEGDSLG